MNNSRKKLVPIGRHSKAIGFNMTAIIDNQIKYQIYNLHISIPKTNNKTEFDE